QQLDHRPQTVPMVNVAGNHAFLRYPSGFLFRFKQPSSPQKLFRLFKIASCLLQRSFAIHNSCSRLVSQPFDVFNGNFHLLRCESDFVARTPEFQQLAQEIAMQVAGMDPQYISREDVPEEVVAEQRRIFYEKALADGNTPEDAERIAEERLNKFFEEKCLLEQACIRDDSKTVGELLKEKIALFGENIVVRRFVRFVVGEE
ncbi:Elongation factor TS, partial [Candidatus Fervidibacteria bacterium JGI MDM2 JNZ-1-D12]